MRGNYGGKIRRISDERRRQNDAVDTTTKMITDCDSSPFRWRRRPVNQKPRHLCLRKCVLVTLIINLQCHNLVLYLAYSSLFTFMTI